MQSTRTTQQLISEALEAVSISHNEEYRAWHGATVKLDLSKMRDGSRFFEEDEAPEVDLSKLYRRYQTVVMVRNATTLVAANELAQGTTSVGVLNFASAKNPGGGFLRGTVAQEESLARSSALFVGLTLFQDQFYTAHRREGDQLYTSRVIWTPSCPVFRIQRDLISDPFHVNFVTCAAPNLSGPDRGSTQHRPVLDYRRISSELLKRIKKILTVFAWGGCEVLVLGAWGCGVFKNDPEVVAKAFFDQLYGKFNGVFERVVFAIPAGPNYDAFSATLLLKEHQLGLA